jgi:hypothetical protein
MRSVLAKVGEKMEENLTSVGLLLADYQPAE